jgi:TetR/AcrR family transcriptional regulator, regulator of biofilm formation and stress response
VRRTQARGDARRQLILEGALALIAREGTAAASHRAVAAEAGVPPTAVTYYFGSRADLLKAALEFYVDEEAAALGALARALEGCPPEEVAERFATALTKRDPGLAQFELYLEARRQPALRETAARCFAAYEEVARAALTAAGLDADPALVLAVADGIGLRRLALGDDRDLAELFLAVVGQRDETRQDRFDAAGA